MMRLSYCLKIFLYGLLLGAVLPACVSVSQRVKSPTLDNREETDHFFVYRGVKKDVVYINNLLHPPALPTKYDAPAIDWQLMGAMAIFDIPFSGLFDTLMLPFDIGAYERSLPEESIADYYGFHHPKKMRVYKVYGGNLRARGTVVYDVDNLQIMHLLGRILDGIAAEGCRKNQLVFNSLKYRIEIYNDKRMIVLEIRDDFLVAPKETRNRFYGETYGRECTLRRMAENVEYIRGANEVTNPFTEDAPVSGFSQ